MHVECPKLSRPRYIREFFFKLRQNLLSKPYMYARTSDIDSKSYSGCPLKSWMCCSYRWSVKVHQLSSWIPLVPKALKQIFFSQCHRFFACEDEGDRLTQGGKINSIGADNLVDTEKNTNSLLAKRGSQRIFDPIDEYEHLCNYLSFSFLIAQFFDQRMSPQRMINLPDLLRWKP
jgi:hypothetical protein